MLTAISESLQYHLQGETCGQVRSAVDETDESQIGLRIPDVGWWLQHEHNKTKHHNTSKL